MSSGVAIAMVFGGLAAFGVYLMLRGALPAGPALGAALQRLNTPSPAAAADSSALGRWLTAHLGGFLRPPVREMRLTGTSVEKYVIAKVGMPMLGLLFPTVNTYLLSLFGLQIPVGIPAGIALALAVLMFFFVDISIKSKAAQAREEFIRAVAVYLDLVALERSAAHGPVESLERAARVGNGWVFDRIRESLDGARLAGIPPWDGLSKVADEIGVSALGDVGDIMRLSGTEGAQVYQTLVSRAESLRGAIRAREQDRANTATTVLYIPTSLTVLVLFVLAGYPFITRILV